MRRLAIALILLLIIAVTVAAEPTPQLLWPANIDGAYSGLLRKSGLTAADLEFPRDLTASALRLPSVDGALQSPRGLVDAAEPWAQLVKEAPHLEQDGALAFVVAAQAFDTLGVSADERYRLADERASGDQLIQLANEKEVIAKVSPTLDDDWQSALAILALDAARARLMARDALASLDAATRRALIEALPQLWLEPGDQTPGARPLAAATGEAPALDAAATRALLLRAAALDRNALARAALTILVASDTLLQGRPASDPVDGWRQDIAGVQGKAMGPFPTVAGDLYLGSSEPNIWRVKDAIIVDLGGDDRYDYDAPALPLDGGATLVVVLDLGGNDTYRGNAWGTAGGALLGVTLLRDLQGDDRYEGTLLTQGGAFLGAALLVDGGGDDTYRADSLAQGAAAFGVGLALDAGGDDAYIASREAQGFGSTYGVGVLFDRSGNDTYRLGVRYKDAPLHPDREQSLGQGMGFGWRYPAIAGGIGALLDAAGNDRYQADIYGQGVGYWYALGILIDGSGHDAYHLGQYGQGAGVHLASGLLADLSGDDVRTAVFGPAQGAAHDLATGVLIDLSGDDLSLCGGTAFGHGNANAVALYVDAAGNDVYQLKQDLDGLGSGASARGSGSFGLFLDLAGKDRYPGREAADGHFWLRGQWGAGWDLQP